MSDRLPIYYFANQVYQYSFAKAVYQRLGGTFLVRYRHRKWRFQWYLRKSQREKFSLPGFDSLPAVRVHPDHKRPLPDPGLYLSNSNSRLHVSHPESKTIFMGHGTGDKPYGGDEKNLLTYDYHFIAGPKHLEKLRDSRLEIPEEKCIPIGNPRFDEYVNGTIDRKAYRRYLGIRDTERKTVLYAPTWEWGNGTLHQLVKPLIRELTPEYNLIVRPHYFDRKYIYRYRLWAERRGFQHVYWSNPANILTNDTMYDFALSDCLISDTSSILYEYLITRNPIIVIENQYTGGHHMPPEMDIHSIARHVDLATARRVRSVLDASWTNHSRADYEALLSNCFYFNDGKSVDRVVEFCQTLRWPQSG
ncbi:MAG: hypothetical protein D6762_06280 [Candidatus Neomarinimicrobiota bacterium]|nr:MAG: hypothetical protein D6762_06280 [Candidatus Neomarinimicrobiota bacterium]